MECTKARESFPAFDEQRFSSEVLGHLEGCEVCRSELAGYRELEARLRALENALFQPPAWLLGTVTERVAEAARRRALAARARARLERATGEHRVAAGSALGLAVLAGAVLVGRLRRGPRVPRANVA